MTIKRAIANFIERQFDVRIVPRTQLSLLAEQEHLSRFFERFQIDCVFDVGANAGQYADMIRRKCGFAGPIVSFEPVPALAAALKRRSASSNSWFIEQTLLSEHVGPVEFNIAEEDQYSSMNKFRTDGPLAASLSRTVNLQASTLALKFDEYQARLGFRRPFLKMDTQGSDVDIARGAGDRLQEFIGLQSELSFDPIYAHVPTAAEALDYYRSQGFVLSAIVPNNSGQFPRLHEMDCIMYRAGADPQSGHGPAK
jgi:FkbM family methyltransferase